VNTFARLAGKGRSALAPGVVLILLGTGCTPMGPSAASQPPATILATPSPSTSPIDTTNWVVYTSRRYGFDIKHPPGWTVNPATHDWMLEKDADDWGGGGSEGFSAPGASLYVTVWSTPAKDTPETLEGVASWVAEYCRQGGGSCIGLDQAVPLCNGTDCHSGLLVTFESGASVEAFFTGGTRKGQMVGVTVGRPEWHESVAKYGGARRLMEGFLAGMGVCPLRQDPTPQGCGE
jgi:hypothetical protein